jgi:polysaccharide chain length determinant protein (PEP-CTERM system associated)
VETVLRYVPYAVHLHVQVYWRWRWAMLAAAWSVALAGWLVVALLPDQYQAATRIYVDTDNLLTPLLRNLTVETDRQHRLEVMQRTLLSRSNVAQVVRASGMADLADGELGLDRMYLQLQKSILVKAEGRNLFSVTYRNRDPQLARRVVASLLDIFVATNVGHNRANMTDARAFIDGQLAEYEDKLKQAEGRLADFKARHMDILAATGSSFSVRLEAARDELNAARVKFSESEITRDQLRAGLARVPQYTDVDTPWPAVGGTTAVSPAIRVRQLEQQLAQLQSQYTELYPDVVAARRALAAARADAAMTVPEDASVRGRAPNMVYDQLKLRQVQAEADLATARSRVQIAEESAARLSAMAKEAPAVEAELAGLNREYGVLKTKYEDLLGRRESVRISAAVETSGDRVQFKVIEPLFVPLTPAAPPRPLLVGAVLAAALAAAVLAGFALERLDDTVRSAEAVTRQFGVKVLGSVPRLEGPTARQDRRDDARKVALATAGLFAACGLMVMLAMHWHWLAPPPPGAGERGVMDEQP